MNLADTFDPKQHTLHSRCTFYALLISLGIKPLTLIYFLSYEKDNTIQYNKKT